MRFRLQYNRIVANSRLPKTVMTRYMQPPPAHPHGAPTHQLVHAFLAPTGYLLRGRHHYIVGIPYASPGEGMGLTPEMPETPAYVIRATVEARKAELALLQLDPSVRRFLELQDKIDESDASDVDDGGASLSLSWRPYDLYDVFEFGRDLAGRQLSTHLLTRLMHGRFPETSSVGRQVILHFLIDHGYAEVTGKTAAGRPTTYRFRPPAGRGTGGRRPGLGMPTNELSQLKSEDLEDVGSFRPRDQPPS